MPNQSKFSIFQAILKWVMICILLSIGIGTFCAAFLWTLNFVTNWRENHLWIIYFLPIAGFAIGLAYYYWGKNVVEGNNLLISELQSPQKPIPFIMAPLIFTSTLITHLFGGSAGREGTAVQIGGTCADQFTKLFKLNSAERKIVIICGISAGFSAVFGTPLAATIFGLEVFVLTGLTYYAIIPAIASAFIANYVSNLWGIDHIHYQILSTPIITIKNISLVIVAGVIFGLTARLFSTLNHKFASIFHKIKYPPIRPLIGGAILVILFLLFNTTKYIGLGIPTIQESFVIQQAYYVFFLKILFCVLTLGAGFKGGEVTPLFFIGATLGSFLSIYLPLPTSFLAALGFVAVFAGAANTPIACLIMGIEMFGVESSIYLILVCCIAYLFSGHKGIYSAQKNGVLKYKFLKRHPFLPYKN